MVYCTMYIHSTLYVRKSVCLHKTKSGFTQWTVSTGHILRIIPSKFNKENSDKQQQRPTTTKTNGGKLIENISIPNRGCVRCASIDSLSVATRTLKSLFGWRSSGVRVFMWKEGGEREWGLGGHAKWILWLDGGWRCNPPQIGLWWGLGGLLLVHGLPPNQGQDNQSHKEWHNLH